MGQVARGLEMGRGREAAFSFPFRYRRPGPCVPASWVVSHERGQSPSALPGWVSLSRPCLASSPQGEPDFGVSLSHTHLCNTEKEMDTQTVARPYCNRVQSSSGDKGGSFARVSVDKSQKPLVE